MDLITVYDLKISNIFQYDLIGLVEGKFEGYWLLLMLFSLSLHMLPPGCKFPFKILHANLGN